MGGLGLASGRLMQVVDCQKLEERVLNVWPGI